MNEGNEIMGNGRKHEFFRPDSKKSKYWIVIVKERIVRKKQIVEIPETEGMRRKGRSSYLEMSPGL